MGNCGLRSLLLVALFVAGSALAGPLRDADIAEMAKAGVSDQMIILKIRSSECDFALGARDLIALKAVGVSEPVMQEMLRFGTATLHPTSGNVAPTASLSGAGSAVSIKDGAAILEHFRQLAKRAGWGVERRGPFGVIVMRGVAVNACQTLMVVSERGLRLEPCSTIAFLNKELVDVTWLELHEYCRETALFDKFFLHGARGSFELFLYRKIDGDLLDDTLRFAGYQLTKRCDNQ